MSRESSSIDISFYHVPTDSPVCLLECKTAFSNLSDRERLYAHHIARASYEGGLIVFLQVSPESPAIFVILHRLFSSESVDSLKDKALSLKWTEDEWENFVMYVAVFYSNHGNYKGFGDTKFVPDVARDKLSALLKASKAAINFPDLLTIYNEIESRMFTLDACNTNLGFFGEGVTGYHSEGVTKDDADLVNRFLISKGLESWNTRLFKKVDGTDITFIIKFASVNVSSETTQFEGHKFVLEKGDYAKIFERVNEHLLRAAHYAQTETERRMLKKYVDHFVSGETKDHKDASRLWIKDVDPVVESYIGFIENYRDPAGSRAEFEGFVAIVNKETSKKFGTLVCQAEKFLEKLPWGKAYEKDTFLKPDFTALDVIAFASSMIPKGINIPNYDDIRQNEGFKNVSLSNVISAMPKTKVNFVSNEDSELLLKYSGMAFEVQVGLHELLGHGSGKLFQENVNGSYNFDKDKTIDIITGEKITSWYEPGETWYSKFGHLSNPYEECRAEAVGYVLSLDDDVLKIFGYEGEMAQTIKYVNWLHWVTVALNSFEMYSPDQKKWGQAHSHARFCLLRVCLEAGEGLITIDEITDENGEKDLKVRVDRTKIESVGKAAVTTFLKTLQAYKSTADIASARALFDRYGSFTEKELRWRDICIAKRKPRPVYLQPNTRVNDRGETELIVYPETAGGVIQSFVDRYDRVAIDNLALLWTADKQWFPST